MKINYTNEKRPEQQGGGNYMWYKNDYSLSLATLNEVLLIETFAVMGKMWKFLHRCRSKDVYIREIVLAAHTKLEPML